MKVINKAYRSVIIFMVILITGCASSGREMTQENLNNIIVGSTTKSQMIQTFGSPLSQSYGAEGKLTMLWHYVYVGPFGTGMKQQNLAVLFDENEVVEKYNIVNNNDGIRFGK